MNFVKITEVGPRDGLQNEKSILSIEDKIQFIRLLSQSGLSHIEITSFVRPDRIPQMADAKELSETILSQKNSEITYSCLTPNERGFLNAVESGFNEVAVFTATSESFTAKNINQTVQGSLDAFKPIFKKARELNIKVRGYISTAIICPYEGKIPPEKALELAKHLLDEGAYEISLGETIGRAVPKDVERLLDVLLKEIPKEKLNCHFHDTFGMAITNTKQALDMGIRSFDSSAGGLGGCPYAKGAAGNLSTEDLLYFLTNEGYETGVNLDKIIEASAFVEAVIGRKLSSRTYLALHAK